MEASTPTTADPIKSIEPPASSRIPVELWLHILESIADARVLWTAVRLVSRAHKTYAEEIFRSTYLPFMKLSLSLPRYDPATGSLRYRGAVPGTEVIFHHTGLDEDKSVVVLGTSSTAPNGILLERLKDTGTLEKQRLDEASIWIWFGRNRGKGAPVNIPKDVRWDGEGEQWIWKEDWRKIVSTYFVAKNTALTARLARIGL